MSLYHFTRKFTREIGMSPHQYLIAIRLAAAKFLLSTTRFSIKEISFQTGFNDVNAFCVCFRQHEKESATTYRKKNLKLK